jgi:type II secretory pathway pseudopilin PulG
MTPSYRRGGFTLVELLLGLAMTAAVVAPLAAMFQTASDSSLSTRGALDLNREARFALERIARSAALAPAVTVGANVANPNTWLPATYALAGSNLVETDTTAKPTRTSTVATNVAAFQLSVPDIGDGQAIMKVDLTLAAGNNTLKISRLLRVGSPL